MLDRDLEPDLPSAKEQWIEREVEVLMREVTEHVDANFGRNNKRLNLTSYIDWETLEEDFTRMMGKAWDDEANDRAIESREEGI